MKQRILAVDDEPHMLKLLERIITEKTPYEITTLGNALEVPAALESRKFDLVIVDFRMPGMDGLDILRLIREQNRTEEVIIITAFGSLESATKALSMGVVDYITKPFKKEQILFTVERVMRWQRVRREAEELRALFDKEPFAEAQAAFEVEYVHRLAQRFGPDPIVLSGRSGLSPERVASLLKQAN